jgi:hypothetical protein
LRKKTNYQKRFVLIVTENFFGEKSGKRIGILLNTVLKNVQEVIAPNKRGYKKYIN